MPHEKKPTLLPSIILRNAASELKEKAHNTRDFETQRDYNRRAKVLDEAADAAARLEKLFEAAGALNELVEGARAPRWINPDERVFNRLKDTTAWCAFYVALAQVRNP